MARKKTEPITTLGNTEIAIVQKSQPLYALWRSKMTLQEFKILDTYLARINSHDAAKREVVFEKGELEHLLGVQRILSDQLKKRLENLMTPIEIPRIDGEKGFKKINLFEAADACPDENGLWQVNLKCTETAKNYFFNVENLGYLRYKLRSITALKSRYTYVLFLYLESNRYRKTWDVDLDELKKLLRCDQEETYKAFKRFNDKILKKIQKELLEKTECRYTYESIKRGRAIVAIRFTMATLPEVDMASAAPDQPVEEVWSPSLQPFHVIAPEFQKVDLNLLVESIPASVTDKVQHFRKAFAALQRANTRKPIKHRLEYLQKLLEGSGAAHRGNNRGSGSPAPLETDYDALAAKKSFSSRKKI